MRTHLVSDAPDRPRLGIWTSSWMGPFSVGLASQSLCRLQKKLPGRRNWWGRSDTFIGIVPKLSLTLTSFHSSGQYIKGKEDLNLGVTWLIFLFTPVVKCFEPFLGLILNPFAQASTVFILGLESWSQCCAPPLPVKLLAIQKRKASSFQVFLFVVVPALLLSWGGSFHQVRRRLSRRPVLEDSDMDEAKVMRVCVWSHISYITYPYFQAM